MRRPLWISLAVTAALLTATIVLTPGRANTAQAKKGNWAIVVHGGAGGTGSTTPADKPLSDREKNMAAFAKIGKDILEKGGSGMDACEAVVRAFEDSGKFNCGKGASATGKDPATDINTYSLDASIMDGKTLDFGAVAGVKLIKNPITCARTIIKKNNNHVLLISTGAEEYAKKNSLEMVEPSYFNAVSKSMKKKFDDDFNGDGYGTVGCVCLDMDGNLAAATSTGGRGSVMPGRVGDTPICGAGTYANNKTCAVSGTGIGENFIRNNTAHTVSALMEYKGLTAKQAADEVMFNIMKKGSGGIIVVSHTGEMVHPFNGGAMGRACADSTGRFEVGVGKEMRKVE